MATVSPANGADSSNPRTTQASGSISAASWYPTPLGIRYVFFSTMRAGIRMYSAYAPLVEEEISQRFSNPRLQKKQVVAGSGIGRHHALPDFEFRYIGAGRDDVASQTRARTRRAARS